MCWVRKKYAHHVSHICHTLHIIQKHIRGIFEHIYAKCLFTTIKYVTRRTVHKFCPLYFMLLLPMAHITEQLRLSHCRYSSQCLHSVLAYRSSVSKTINYNIHFKIIVKYVPQKITPTCERSVKSFISYIPFGLSCEILLYSYACQPYEIKLAQNWQKYPGISASRFPPGRFTDWQIWWICQQIHPPFLTGRFGDSHWLLADLLTGRFGWICQQISPHL